MGATAGFLDCGGFKAEQAVVGSYRRRRTSKAENTHKRRMLKNCIRRRNGFSRKINQSQSQSQSQLKKRIRSGYSKRSLNICRRLRKLQRLIPGGRDMKQIDVLFQETADYIMALKIQVQFLQTLSNLCSVSAAVPSQDSP